jgi:hypothetical protein
LPGGAVQDLLDRLIQALGIGENLVQQGTTNHITDRGLGDLADRDLNVLDLHDRLHRVHPAEVGHRRNTNGDIVAGNDLL